MLAEIREFLALLESPPQDADARLEALALALDKLALAYHSLPQSVFDDNAQERPELGELVEYQKFRNQAVAGFPGLDSYLLCDPLLEGDRELLMADPYDDLADLAAELSEGLWEWENNGAGQAAWQLRLVHWHWENHLRCLRYYLFCKMQPELNPG